MLGGQELTRGARDLCSCPWGGEGGKSNAAVCSQLCEEGCPSHGARMAAVRGLCPGAGIGLCTAAREGRLGKLLASLRSEKGARFLVENTNVVPVSSLLCSPLEVSGQKGTGCCGSSRAVLQLCRAVVTASGRVKDWALSFP